MDNSIDIIRLLFEFLNNAMLYLLIGYLIKRMFDKADKSEKTHVKTELKDFNLEVAYDDNNNKDNK